MIRYRYNHQLSPPAPFVHVSLQGLEDGAAIVDLPAQLDTAADLTVVGTQVQLDDTEASLLARALEAEKGDLPREAAEVLLRSSGTAPPACLQGKRQRATAVQDALRTSGALGGPPGRGLRQPSGALAAGVGWTTELLGRARPRFDQAVRQ